MGRLFLIQFDQTPDNHFYLCRTCQTHIALSDDFHYNLTYHNLAGGLFENVVNVYKLGPEQERRVGEHTVADVYCNKCGDLLGVHFIEVEPNDVTVKEGFFLLNWDKHLMWNGHEIVDTHEE